MLDHLEAMNGKKSHQNHFFLQNPSFSSHLPLKNVFAQWLSKTKCGLKSLIPHKALFGHKNVFLDLSSPKCYLAHISSLFAFKFSIFTLIPLFFITNDP